MLTLEPRRPGDVDHELIWSLVGAAGLAAMAALGVFGVPKLGPVCLLKKATGLPCPACGGTRSVAALARVHLWDSFALNPLVFIGALVFGAWWLYAVAATIFRPERRLRLRIPNTRAGTALRVAVLTAIALNWLYLAWAGR